MDSSLHGKWFFHFADQLGEHRPAVRHKLRGNARLIELDINGDGYVDLVQQWNNAGILWLLPYYFNGTAFTVGSWINTGQGYASGTGGSPGLMALDINGDGKADLIQQWNCNGTLCILPYISDGTNLNSTNWVNTGQPYASGPGGTPGLLALDVNGDGRMDLVQQVNSGGTLVLNIYLSSGTSFYLVNTFNTGQGYYSGPALTPGLIALDINGDGLTDLVQQWNNNGILCLMQYFSGGSNFYSGSVVNTGQGFSTGPAGSPGLIPLDINGDGKTDLVQQWNNGGVLMVLPLLSNGGSFTPTNWVNTGQGYGSGPAGAPGLLAFDVDGDGRTDLIQEWNYNGDLMVLPLLSTGTGFTPTNWNDTGQGYGSGPAATPGLLAGNYLNPVSPLQMSMVGTVSLTNLSNPTWGSNFNVGDTLQTSITGAMPNQPVYVSDSSAGTSQAGQTDWNGNFIYTVVEQSNNIGAVTQVWAVGGVTASPALSFLVGQLGGSGTVSTTDMSQSSDGSLQGISTLSITNGVVSTYSATELDYSTSAYYDTQTVATLFDNGAQVAQTTSPSAVAVLSANANPWDDYQLETDHNVVAYFTYYQQYVNPMQYIEDSCDDDTGDCNFGGEGDGYYYVDVAEIYVGSTFAEELAIPDGQTSVLQNDPAGLPASVQTKVQAWRSALIASLLAIGNYSKSTQGPPVPAYLKLIGDCQYLNSSGSGVPARPRSYKVFGSDGQPYAGQKPILVKENILSYYGPSLVGGGNWGRNVSADEPITALGVFEDDVAYGSSTFLQQRYIQQFWASSFNLPSGLQLQSIPGFPAGTVPLTVIDQLNLVARGNFAQLNLVSDPHFIGVDGDNGNAPNISNGRACGSN